MAIFHMSVKPCQRSKGRSAVAAAAYRAAERLTDSRTGLIHDYTKKTGVEIKEIFTPEGEKAPSRAELWSMAEQAEKRKDGTTAREYEIALPAELTPDQQAELARDFCRFLVERYGIAADLCIHAPSTEGDSRNRHAHILTTTRKLEEGQLTKKATVELADRDRQQAGLCSRRKELEDVRAIWAELANTALERAGIQERITEKSFKALGIEDAPSVHIGPAAVAMERRGIAADRVQQAQAREAAKKSLEIDSPRADARPTTQPEVEQRARSVDAARPVQTNQAQGQPPEKPQTEPKMPTLADLAKAARDERHRQQAREKEMAEADLAYRLECAHYVQQLAAYETAIKDAERLEEKSRREPEPAHLAEERQRRTPDEPTKSQTTPPPPRQKSRGGWSR